MNPTTRTIFCLAASAGLLLTQGMRGGNGLTVTLRGEDCRPAWS